MSKIIIRRAVAEDLDKIVEVEHKATPGLQYLGDVFELFAFDKVGEFSVAELEGKIVACGKFTVMPDGSAWLESLRVTPEHQGLGIGKQFYQRFFELAPKRAVKTMRMYTNSGNVVSKGLAERFGFQLADTHRGMFCQMTEVEPNTVSKGLAKRFDSQPADTHRGMFWQMTEIEPSHSSDASFLKITDPDKAIELLMPYQKQWGAFLVMNRTWYQFNAATLRALATQEKVYATPKADSVMILGARFMPEKALHIGLYGGCKETCLSFAQKRARELGVKRLVCMFPPALTHVEQDLTRYGFMRESYDCIVMEVNIAGQASS